MIVAAFRDALVQLAPRAQFQNSATFGVYVGSICATIGGFVIAAGATDGGRHPAFLLAVAAWLWLSVLLAYFAEALAVESAQARAAALRSMGGPMHAKRLLDPGRKEYRLVDADTLRRGDLVLVEANDVIPADGTVIEGVASVSEAAITGESAPVLRAAAPELAGVRCGTHVLSDWLVVRVRSRRSAMPELAALPVEEGLHGRETEGRHNSRVVVPEHRGMSAVGGTVGNGGHLHGGDRRLECVFLIRIWIIRRRRGGDVEDGYGGARRLHRPIRLHQLRIEEEDLRILIAGTQQRRHGRCPVAQIVRLQILPQSILRRGGRQPRGRGRKAAVGIGLLILQIGEAVAVEDEVIAARKTRCK
jgi:hypothetical protein